MTIGGGGGIFIFGCYPWWHAHGRDFEGRRPLAYAILEDGTMELLAIDIGNAESDRSWGKFVEKLKARGLTDPLLVCSDGNQGVINAIDAHFTTSYRQRCLKHREQNILDAVPKEEQ